MIHVAAAIADFLWLLIRAALSLAGQVVVAGLAVAAVVGAVMWWRRRRR